VPIYLAQAVPVNCSWSILVGDSHPSHNPQGRRALGLKHLARRAAWRHVHKPSPPRCLAAVRRCAVGSCAACPATSCPPHHPCSVGVDAVARPPVGRWIRCDPLVAAPVVRPTPCRMHAVETCRTLALAPHQRPPPLVVVVIPRWGRTQCWIKGRRRHTSPQVCRYRPLALRPSLITPNTAPAGPPHSRRRRLREAHSRMAGFRTARSPQPDSLEEA
jgi:hypothetical protein